MPQKLILVQVTVRLIPLGAAKPLKQNRFKITASKRFDTVVRNLRRRVGIRESESIFCYINQTFSPAPDEGVGNLWRVSLVIQPLPSSNAQRNF